MNAKAGWVVAHAVIAVLIGFSTVAEAQKPARPLKVFCTIEEHPSGFVDQRGQSVRDSLQDMKQALSKKRDWIELQEGPERADVVVRLVSRGIEPTGEFEAIGTHTTYDRGRTRRLMTRSREIKKYVVRGVLVVDDYKSELAGSVLDTYVLGGPWRTAAGDLANQVEKWIKTNYVKVVIDRRQR
jgi:hypothetical protein